MIRADAARVDPAARLRGELRLPGDKSISHRALLLATLAAGESRISGAGDGADIRSTAGIMRALGAAMERIEREVPDDRNVDYLVVSPGADALRQPDGALDGALAGRQRGQDQRPMADRLVAGQTELAAQAGARRDPGDGQIGGR